MNVKQLQSIVENIAYPGLQILVGQSGGASYLEVRPLDDSREDGQVCRRLIPSHMTATDVVHEAFSAIVEVETMHCHEWFLYLSRPIFSRRVDAKALASVALHRDRRAAV